ncbi:hypothetical protein Ais01nite_19920 [Asanoa ishikariensis]|uniref:Tetratricopeptide repeat-containing protein n=1 Tax=Asanoa ishikariensis TaxID=137265 RepID=A0A1H3UAI9_9ACTN|nr:tetratricopeptide repeat protein [Asanoa ishikariensis]GIF63957.1 hypothetical protein Ais01nite_19920 [Asanoa ishikariensis]SDZ59490.1 hypothetical protein SAMN05421684_6881 [Asanoa ishikariensis]
MEPLIARREASGQPQDDILWPSIGPDFRAHLAADEPLRWTGTLRDVSELRPVGDDPNILWTMGDFDCPLAITDRRLIYVTREIKTKSGPMTGYLIGLHANDDRKWADHRYAGQVRFEWPTRIQLILRKVAFLKLAVILITCRRPDGQTTVISLTMSLHRGFRAAAVTALVQALVRDIASHRLMSRPGQDTAALEQLRATAAPSAQSPGELTWDLPAALPIGIEVRRPPTAPVSVAQPPPPAVAPRPARSGGVKPLNVVAMVLAVVLIVCALGSLPDLGTAGSAVAKRDVAREATAAGDVRRAARAWLDVLAAAPRSVEALLRLSCLSWDAGYQDEAVAYFDRALGAGVRWDDTVIGEPCFVNAPTLHRLRLTYYDGSSPALYVQPKNDDETAAILTAIARGAPGPAEESTYRDAIAPYPKAQEWQRLLAIGCLNERAGLRYHAGKHFSAGLDLHLRLREEPLAVGGPLESCVKAMGPNYGFVRRNGSELFFPKDLGDRMFIPESSPLPSRLPLVLP